jgi:hypothetical protein
MWLEKTVSLMDGLKRHSSTRLRSSLRFGKRQSACPAKRLLLASVSACAHVEVVAEPVQVLPVQVCPSLQRFQIRPVG